MSTERSRVPILNETYKSHQEQHSIYIKRRKKLLIRRLTLFFVFVAIVSYTLIKTLYTQASVLNEKQDQLKEVQAEYNQIKENQEILKENITKLQDDEYVGKYARQEYYLSDEGEIIFSIPDKEVDDSVD
ncbi:septum formation initiator family protein [Caldifermentibacillus hisashii]|jgi:cell division protein DivIC|uniref:Septum formation initiator family protein n=1 Tax=Caldifermentibacillus hisashii TaxID=996558 RepID=A0ABU9JS98_9BACI|nr:MULTISPECIES: septum formation initiator family protein [Bacillaceae]MCB5935411.1 septum formation initiator family protein [Bacillus sp. DFI.2.34]NWN97756.1 septum formation initiator family protein [Bacillus sp. (in: firmicutes)]AWI10789.1 cell division protein DIVIC [Caldibacillus thermoamylovorans]MCB7076279.1 septum formation initiator family protein [Caldibacillus thermoamylovorans]MCM3055207.1 septum formation initiator family protein [Caldibacillus thermoamylovorans]